MTCATRRPEELADVEHVPRPQATDAGITAITSLANLEELDIRYGRVTDEGLHELPRLKKLQVLHVGNDTITSAGLRHLAGMQLRVLDLFDNCHNNLGLKHYLAATQASSRLRLDPWGFRYATDKGLHDLANVNEVRVLSSTATTK